MTTPSFSFSKPLAVVTGASSGIGYELARQFAQHGFDLVIAAEDPGIAQAARTIGELGAKVEPMQVDLARYEGNELLWNRLRSDVRPVEAIAINAGVGVYGDFARETSLADELRLVDLNVKSTVHLAKRVLEDMVARGRGRVLFTSSIAGTMPTPDVAKQAFDALMAGKDRVVAATALSTKLEGLLSKFLPEDYKAKKHRKMAEHGSATR